ncbi:hypothetical protein D9M71_321470 [compost metagenome]
MNSPTTKASRPSAVRLRWKLSLSRARSEASLRCSNTSCAVSCGGRLGSPRAKSPGSSSHESFSGASSSRWATPMSTSSTPGATCARTSSGGKVCPDSLSGCAPTARPRSARVSAAIQVRPGWPRKPGRSKASSACPASAVPAGRVRGSIPTSRRRCPPCPCRLRRPCRTGDTGQPACRSSIKVRCSISPPWRGTSRYCSSPNNWPTRV